MTFVRTGRSAAKAARKGVATFSDPSFSGGANGDAFRDGSPSSGSRHSAEKTNPKKKLMIPRAAKAPRQPTIKTNGAANNATTTPPAGTPVCLMPMAVARSSR
jgi:hypothetical protein